MLLGQNLSVLGKKLSAMKPKRQKFAIKALLILFCISSLFLLSVHVIKWWPVNVYLCCFSIVSLLVWLFVTNKIDEKLKKEEKSLNKERIK